MSIQLDEAACQIWYENSSYNTDWTVSWNHLEFDQIRENPAAFVILIDEPGKEMVFISLDAKALVRWAKK